MKCNKILFATDFSQSNRAAFDYAVALARDFGATLLIAHVEELPVSYPGGEMVVVQPDYPNPVLRKLLEAMVPDVAKVRCEHQLVMGEPAHEIVKLAADEHADLIVMGSHGRTGLRRVLMGSVAESVMRLAGCPVLTVKQRTTASEEHAEPEPSAPSKSGAKS